MALALDEPKDSYNVSERDSVKYIVDDRLMARVGDITIDFVQEGPRFGFILKCANSIAEPFFSGGACAW